MIYHILAKGGQSFWFFHFVLDVRERHDREQLVISRYGEDRDQAFGELIGAGDEKMVVFSQWERMTRIVAMELDKQGIGYRYLHGGVPSVKREELFTRFNQDPEVRIFLSTDAVGTGLNLQSASIMINLDIPWNPAVLEQRIARIHRLGQKNKVSMINMVAAGTIEHRMTELLKFKSSLAAGILDRGEDVIFLEESKFKKLMSTVERMVPGQTKVVVAREEEMKSEKSDLKGVLEPGLSSEEIGPEAPTLFDELDADKDGMTAATTSAEKESQHEGTPEPAEPGELLRQGMDFLSGLAQTLSDPEATRRLVDSVVQEDKEDGRTYLKIHELN